MKVIKINMDAGVNEVRVKCFATIYICRSEFPSTLFSYLSSGVEPCHSKSLVPAYAKATVKAEEGRPQWFRCSEDLVWYN